MPPNLHFPGKVIACIGGHQLVALISKSDNLKTIISQYPALQAAIE